MADEIRNSVLRSVRQLFGAAEPAGPTDAELLRRFAQTGDEAAFELLVWRHAGLVFSVCRQVLREEYAVDDAFQATFLVLLRKAGSVARGEALPGWLHRVAFRVALRARQRSGRDPARGGGDQLDGLPAPPAAALEPDVRQMLHEEIARLPARYRVAVVCCYLEARTHEEAARELGWAKGTVAGRLARARELLRRRLLRRGVTLAAAAVATELSAGVAAGAVRVSELVKGLGGVASGGAGKVTPAAVALAESVIREAFMSKLRYAAVAVLAVALTGLGAALGTGQPARPKAEAGRPKAAADAGRAAAADPLEEALLRAQVRRSLKLLALAMHNYHDTFGHLPPPALSDAKGKPLLSWRVAILPYIEQDNLYKQFRLNEPWDSPHNKKLLAQMPKLFAPAAGKAGPPHSTYYQLLVGPGAIWQRAAYAVAVPADIPGGRSTPGGPGGAAGTPDGGGGPAVGGPAHLFGLPRMQTITDGTSNTLLIVEAGAAVPWTKPDDVPFDAKKPPRLGGQFAPVFHAAFADGSVRAVPKKLDDATLRALITANGGEVVNLPDPEAIARAGESPLRRRAIEKLRQRNAKLKEEAEVVRDILNELRSEVESLRWIIEEDRLLKLDPTAAALQKENAQLEKTLKDARDDARKLLVEIQRLKQEVQKRKK